MRVPVGLIRRSHENELRLLEDTELGTELGALQSLEGDGCNSRTTGPRSTWPTYGGLSKEGLRPDYQVNAPSKDWTLVS